MTDPLPAACERAAALVRSQLAAAGVAWAEAWYLARFTDQSRQIDLNYRPPGGPPEQFEDVTFEPSDVIGQARSEAGAGWNQILLTVYPDGRHAAAFADPVRPPEPGRAYTEAELLDNLAECARRDLAFEPWATATAEFDAALVLFLSTDAAPSVSGCNGDHQWLKALWERRRAAGAEPIRRGTLRLTRDRPGYEVELLTGPPEPAAPAPPPPPSLGELYDRLVAAQRDYLDGFARHMEAAGQLSGGWVSARLTADWGAGNSDLEVWHAIRFGDGKEWEEPADEDVEMMAGDLCERLAAGEDASPLIGRPGLTVTPGRRTRLALDLTNPPAHGPA